MAMAPVACRSFPESSMVKATTDPARTPMAFAMDRIASALAFVATPLDKVFNDTPKLWHRSLKPERGSKMPLIMFFIVFSSKKVPAKAAILTRIAALSLSQPLTALKKLEIEVLRLSKWIPILARCVFTASLNFFIESTIPSNIFAVSAENRKSITFVLKADNASLIEEKSPFFT